MAAAGRHSHGHADMLSSSMRVCLDFDSRNHNNFEWLRPAGSPVTQTIDVIFPDLSLGPRIFSNSRCRFFSSSIQPSSTPALPGLSLASSHCFSLFVLRLFFSALPATAFHPIGNRHTRHIATVREGKFNYEFVSPFGAPASTFGRPGHP